MRIKKENINEITFPLDLVDEEKNYLIWLDLTDATIRIEKKDSAIIQSIVYLRDNQMSYPYKKEITSSFVMKLIDKKYLILLDEDASYFYYTPNLSIIYFIKNCGFFPVGGIFSILHNDKPVQIRFIKKMGSEKELFLRKKKEIDLNGELILHKALPLGITSDCLFQFVDFEKEGFFIVSEDAKNVFQVFPL